MTGRKHKVVFDSVKELDRSWLVEIDGRELFVGKSIADVDEEAGTIEVPDWLVEKEGLEGYIEEE